MNFKNIIRIAEEEVRIPDNWYINNILNKIVERVNRKIEEDPSALKTVLNETKKEIIEYTNKQSQTSIKTKTIEYYISKRSYSPSKYNLDRAYKDICKDIEQGNINVDETANKDIQYTYNIDENIKSLVAGIVCKIRYNKKQVIDYLNKHEVFEEYRMLNNKSKAKLIKSISMDNQEAQELYKKIMIYVDKSEKELVEEIFKNYTKNASENVRNECIKSITTNIKLLNNYGFIKKFVEGNNVLNKRIYLLDSNYTYEETKELLSEENLKKLSPEQLIGMAAYWDNRAAKTINEINKATYVLSHPELYESKKTDNGKIKVNVSEESLKNVHLKMNILQKLSFEIFDEAEMLKDDENDSNEFEIDYEVDDICEKYGKDYKNYLDKKLLYSRNELRGDVIEALEFENSIYNLYITKSSNIQALLITTLNSGIDSIENYGYINEKQRGIRNFMIVGVDIPGMNMPLRLHTRENSVLEVLKSAQNGNTKFPKYKGGDDFLYKGEGAIMPTHIYVPISKEKTKKIKEAVKHLNEKDKYANTIRHLEYIATKGKMPTHMLEDVETAVDLENDERDLER